MAAPQPLTKPLMHASVCEVERGLYRADYTLAPTLMEAAPGRFPPFQVSTKLNEVRCLVEDLAAMMGFAGVVWDGSEDSSGGRRR